LVEDFDGSMKLIRSLDSSPSQSKAMLERGQPL
jgi:hypothetical protein